MKTKLIGWSGIAALLLSATAASAAGVSRSGKWKKDDTVSPAGVNLNVAKPSDARVVSARRFLTEDLKNTILKTDSGFSLVKQSSATINGTYAGNMPCKQAYRLAGGSTARMQDCDVRLTLEKAVSGQTSDWRPFVLEIEVSANSPATGPAPGSGPGGPLGAGNNGAKTIAITGAKYPDNYAVNTAKRSEPLAAQIVYDAMVDISQKFHKSPYQGSKQFDPSTGYPQKHPYLNLQKNTIESCLGNVAAHWSDLIIHYYCQHGFARSCYTGNARNGVPRDKLVDTCKADNDFKWVVNSKFNSGGKSYNHLDVFNYVMRSQTFAFDLKQENDMINRFYNVSGSGCSKRPRRGIDPTDGTHCRANKTIPMQPAGR